MEEYQLRFNLGDTAFLLEVLDDQDAVVDSWDMLETTCSRTITVYSGEYVIDSGDPIEDEEDPHKLQMGGGNVQTFSAATFEGIGIMDLRDMGREGQLTATYTLGCCEMRFQGKGNAYPLWIKVANTGCVTVLPAL